MAHNHPSETPKFSDPHDLLAENALKNLLKNTGINMSGFLAIAGNKYAHIGELTNGSENAAMPMPWRRQGPVTKIPIIEDGLGRFALGSLSELGLVLFGEVLGGFADIGVDAGITGHERIEREVRPGIIALPRSGRCRDGIDHAVQHRDLHYVPERRRQHIAGGR